MAHEDETGYEEWIANRLTLTQERNHPNHWFNRAADLHASAGALWHVMQLGNQEQISKDLGFFPGHSMSVACRPVYLMLCGLAIEVVLKSALVKRGISFDKTHHLDALTTLLGITNSPNDLSILNLYEQSVLWAGRYPLPMRCTDDKLRNFWSLAGTVLTSSTNLGREYGLDIRVGNDADSWGNFDERWQKYAALFHSQD